MIGNTTFKGGLDLKFFERQEFESLENTLPNQHASIIGRNALRLLMMGWPDTWTQLISWPVFKAVFIQRDPSLLKELRYAFQQGFKTLFNQLDGMTLNKEQSEQVQLYLSNCLSLLPYSDLTPYESFKIPHNIDGRWVLVDYSVQPIELTPRRGLRNFFIKDHDRVFAYGLQPINNPRAQSHLIFMGTTYPAGQGFLPQINTDLKGFDDVGASLYKSGRKNIEEWTLRQKSKVHVCGVSLGGSLSLLMAIDLGQYISRVDALNPAGLHDGHHKSKFDKWDDLTIRPQVVVQEQGDDPVSLFGVWKKEWQILKVTPPKDKQGPNFFCDHFLNYAGFAETEFSYISAEEDNSKRSSRNFWIFSLGRSAVYYGAVAPFSYVVRPFLYFAYEHWKSMALGVLVLFTINLFVVLPFLGALPFLALTGALVGLVFSACVEVLPHLRGVNFSGETEVLDSVDQEPSIADLHDPQLPRNPEMDIYNPDNSIDVGLTHQEVHTYYKVMRCLVKQKEFLPTDDEPGKHVDGLSKQELLLASQNSANPDQIVPFRATKAKIAHMRRALTLVEQFGMDNESALKPALEQDYQQYCLGKY